MTRAAAEVKNARRKQETGWWRTNEKHNRYLSTTFFFPICLCSDLCLPSHLPFLTSFWLLNFLTLQKNLFLLSSIFKDSPQESPSIIFKSLCSLLLFWLLHRGFRSLIRGGGAWRRLKLHFQPMVCLKLLWRLPVSLAWIRVRANCLHCLLWPR